MLCFSTTNVEVNILPCEENKKIQVVVMVKFGLGDEFLSFSDTSDANKKNKQKKTEQKHTVANYMSFTGPLSAAMRAVLPQPPL